MMRKSALPFLNADDPIPAATPSSALQPDADELALLSEMQRLYTVLNPPLADGEGRVVQFVSAQPGVGTSTIARAFARAATLQAQQYVTLLDLNATGPSQYDWFEQASRRDRNLAMGDPIDIGVDPTPLWRLSGEHVVTELPNAARGPLMSFHRVGASRLLVSRFRHESLREGQTAQLGNQPTFWDNLRSRINFTVVDTPAASRSVDAIGASTLADMVVLVVEAEATRVPVMADLRDLLLARGANLAGVVLNKRRFYIPEAIYRRL
ncbi:MAG: hypothetical protein ACK4QW_14535 [Alphaproteobacteria bacterium]